MAHADLEVRANAERRHVREIARELPRILPDTQAVAAKRMQLRRILVDALVVQTELKHELFESIALRKLRRQPLANELQPIQVDRDGMEPAKRLPPAGLRVESGRTGHHRAVFLGK